MSCDLFGTFKTLLWLFYFRNMSFFIFCNELITKNRVFPCSSTQCVMYDTPPASLWPEKECKKWDKQSLNQWNKGIQSFDHLTWFLSSWYQPGSDPLRVAWGERSGNHGQLQVPGQRQQTKRGQRQRLPRPVVTHQLWAQKVCITVCVRLLTRPACFRPLLGLLLIQRWNTHYFH